MCESLHRCLHQRLTNCLLHLSDYCSIAIQLKESKISLETQIREELEAEYMVKQQEIIASYENKNLSDLESKLREELSQVKDERERWKSEQEDLMKRIIDSQQQFESVREGFKSTSLFFLRSLIPGSRLITPHFTHPLLFHDAGKFLLQSR